MKKPSKAAAQKDAPKIYTVEITPSANRQFKKLPPEIARQILPALMALGKNPRPYGYKKLVGRPGYRIRVGDYRIQYSIFDTLLLVEIVKVGQRGNFYDE